MAIVWIRNLFSALWSTYIYGCIILKWELLGCKLVSLCTGSNRFINSTHSCVQIHIYVSIPCHSLTQFNALSIFKCVSVFIQAKLTQSSFNNIHMWTFLKSWQYKLYDFSFCNHQIIITFGFYSLFCHFHQVRFKKFIYQFFDMRCICVIEIIFESKSRNFRFEKNYFNLIATAIRQQNKRFNRMQIHS